MTTANSHMSLLRCSCLLHRIRLHKQAAGRGGERTSQDGGNKRFHRYDHHSSLFGRIKSGKASDIRLGDIIRAFYEKSAYFVMKNTAALTSDEFEEVKVMEETVEETEKALITENSGQLKVSGLIMIWKSSCCRAYVGLQLRKKEGETKTEFEKRVNEDTDRVMQKIIS